MYTVEFLVFSAVTRKHGRKVKGGEGEKESKEVREKGTQVRQEAKGRRRKGDRKEVGNRKEGRNGRGGKKLPAFQYKSTQ